jgi:phosphate-selective porin OprO/OprP
VNGVDIRRARLGVEGEGFGTYFYRFDVDFVAFDGTHATRPTIFDAYLDIQQLPVLGNLRVGHFREPFSMERLESSHDFAFLERSIAINTLTPFRNVGLMAFDWNESETRTWSYGVFHENTDEYGASVRDSNPMAVTGRTTWLPFVDDNLDVPRLLHVGASYSYRRLNPASRQFQQTPEAIVRRALIAAPSFVDTGVISLENYHVAGVEFAAMKAAFALQGELVWLTGQGTTSDPVMFHGGYLEAMYWLSGENRNYNRKLGIHGAVQPNCNFLCRETTDGVCCGGGAWEVAARVSYLNLNSGSIQGGALTDMTFGLNWYYAVRSRVMFNYIHAFLDRSSLRSHADIFSVRFQFTF